jgi:hypothetical protein
MPFHAFVKKKRDASLIDLTSYNVSSMISVKLSLESYYNECLKPLTQLAFESLMRGYKVCWFVMKGKDWLERG